MLDSLPTEISDNILSRLPIKNLITCTAVRKSWRSMIKNPRFMHTHLESNNTRLLLMHGLCGGEVQSHGHSISFSNKVSEEFYSLHYDDPAFHEYCKIEIPTVGDKDMGNDCLRVVGTCNRLVCLTDDVWHYGYKFVVLNPSIRRSVTLPKPTIGTETYGYRQASVGFGFDAKTNDYKVVRLVTVDELKWRPSELGRKFPRCKTLVEVYSLATGAWSMLTNVTHEFRMEAHTPQAFCRGALHWQALRWIDDDFYYFIVAFDVSSKSFSEIQMPSRFVSDLPLTLQLSVLGDRKSIGLFAMYGARVNSYREIWEMKEYGIHDSWNRLIRLVYPDGPQRGVLPRALCFRYCGEVIVSKKINEDSCSRHSPCPGYELFSIDIASQQLKSLGICGYSYYTANSYEESLILLDIDNAVSYGGKEMICSAVPTSSA